MADIPEIKPDDQVKMLDPDGNKYTVAGNSVKEAQDQGWTIPEIGLQELHIARQAEQRNANPNYKYPSIAPGSDYANYLDKFLNQASLGVKPIIENATDTPEEAAVRKASMEATEQEHPLASALSTSAGFASSLAIPGPVKAGQAAKDLVLGGNAEARIMAAEAGGGVSRATLNEVAKSIKAISGKDVVDRTISEVVGHGAEAGISKKTTDNIVPKVIQEQSDASFSRKLAASAVQGAVMSEAYALPSQIAHIAVGDPDKAAESLLWNIGLGSVLGVGGELTHAGLSKIGEAMEGLAPKLENTADDLSLNQIGMKTNIAQKAKDKVITYIKENDLVGKRLSDEDKQDLLDKIGKEIGDHEDDFKREQLNREKLPQYPGADPAEIVDSRSKALQTQMNTNPDLAYQKSGMYHSFGVKPEELADNLKQQFEIENPGILNDPLHKPATNTLNDVIESIKRNGNEPLSFADTKTLEKNIAGNSYKSANLTSEESEKNLTLQWAEQKLSNARKAEAQKMFIASDEPQKFASYTKAMKDYSAVKTMMDPKLQLSANANSIMPSGMAINQSIGHGAWSLATGHPIIGAAAVAGTLLKPMISQISKRTILPLAIRGLYKAAETNPEMLGPILAKTLNEAADKHFGNLAPLIINSGKSLPIRGTQASLDSFLGSSAKGLNSSEKYEKVQNQITNAVANPDLIAQRVGAIASIFGMHPQLKSLVAQKQLQAISYLYDNLPKNPHPNEPFSKNDWKPSEQEKNQFLKILSVVEDPSIIIHKLANPGGTISIKEVEAMKTIYPSLYAKLVGEVVKSSYAPGSEKASLNTRNKIDTFAGGGVEPSLQPQNTANIQNSFTKILPSENPQGSAPSPKHTNRSLKSSGDSLMTSVQKRASK